MLGPGWIIWIIWTPPDNPARTKNHHHQAPPRPPSGSEAQLYGDDDCAGNEPHYHLEDAEEEPDDDALEWKKIKKQLIRRPILKALKQDEPEVSKKVKDEEDNWDFLDVDLPYT
ncbi:hypothetical protein POM88_038844 [Heracleum sosnowskyi]|uniref:Uncharacterized protein n=1 Tax=Heracleum sosnowskyi TaxID=360622 RepID=A0AAD8HBP8_9APIA|nr:hypothetical protein POM88_038844 [Heracleum sosnowskyi]